MADIDVLEGDGAIIVVATVAGQNTFDFDFLAYAGDTVRVRFKPNTADQAELTFGVHYTVAGLAQEAGGSITLAGAYSGVSEVDDELLIYRSTPIRRLFDYQNAGDFRAEVVNRELDTMIMIDQENRREVARTIKVPVGTATPILSVGANGTVPIWRDGNLEVGPTGDQIESAQANAEQVAEDREAVEAIRDLLEGQATTVTVETAADLATLELGVSAVPFVRTATHNLASKLGAALYKKVEVEPMHALWEPALGGGFWELNEPRVNGAMAGMIGDNSYDNGQVIEDLIGYAGLFGAEAYIPRGGYKTSQVNRISAPSKPPSVIGDGHNQSVIYPIAGNYTALEFDQCTGLHLQGFSVQKRGAQEDTLGTGIWISQTAYFYLKDIHAWGFAVGLRLVNSLSGIIERPLLIWNEYGLYLDVDNALPFVSRPNAITILSPTIGLNSRRGIFAREPGCLTIEGGSVEGNGYGKVSDHGGIYILNAGTEGAVINIHGVQMERNRGEADIHIAGLINAGTIYNIVGNGIFPIDNTDITTDRIYFENGVQQVANIHGNSFQHKGGYTPNAARRYVRAANPALLDLNVMGDVRQFYTATEFPSGLGGMGMSYGMRINADGTIAKNARGPTPWTVTKGTVGTYTINLPAYLNAQDFSWAATCNSGNVGDFIERIFVGSGAVTVITRNTSGSLVDARFDITANSF